jgi:hypothetical protein
VVAPTELELQRPDIIVILAWLYSDIIIKNNTHFLEQGGEFLVPLPQSKIIALNTIKYL